jgi:hypothetical protein
MLPFVVILIWPLFLIAVLGGGGYLALRAIRAFERRGTSAPEFVALSERVELLEQQLDAQTAELRRLAEGQQFTERLMADRVNTAT